MKSLLFSSVSRIKKMDQVQSFRHKNQRLKSEQILQAIADGTDIELINCTIEGPLHLSRLFSPEENFKTDKLNIQNDRRGPVLTLVQSLSFNNCTFENEVFFASPWEKPDDLRIVFTKDVFFNSSIFKSPARFSEAVFRGLAGFDGCEFQRVVCFRRGDFQNRALFRTVSFEGYGLFNQCRFGQDVRFVNSCFARGGNFTETRFEAIADFDGVYSRTKSVPVHEGVYFVRKYCGDDESFWRFIKQTCQEAGDYQQAGESFYHERSANFWKRLRGPNYEQLSATGRLLRFAAGIRLLPELIFGRLLFGYGERPARILFAGFFIIICCGLFYSSGCCKLVEQSVSHSDITLFDGLYFSTITFTTVGYGDIYPAYEDRFTRFVVMFEALCGVLLMPMFVVSLAKRFSRS